MTDRALPFPSERVEEWKYTPVRELADFVGVARIAAKSKPPRATVAHADEFAATRLVVVNGLVDTGLSDPVFPDGVEMRAVAGPQDSAQSADAFEELNRRSAVDTVTLTVRAGTVLPCPLHVLHVSVAGPERAAMANYRLELVIERDAEATVVETHGAAGGRMLANATSSVVIGENAQLDYVQVRHGTSESMHISRTRVTQADDAVLRMCSVVTGAAIARQEVEVRLQGDEARASLAGVSRASARQCHDTLVTVDHAASRGVTSQLFRGIVDDYARGSFTGRVFARPGTKANDASQAHHSLLLSPTAEANSRPWLQILADDVRCSHGATVGHLDPEALLYLRTRGIPADEARAVLVQAFAADVLDNIVHTEVRAYAHSALGGST